MLKGRKATTNWFYRIALADGAEFPLVRYHRDGKYVIGAGVSRASTRRLSHRLIGGELLAKTIQLGVEYYPAPPFPEKTPAEAPAEALAMVKEFEKTGGPMLLAMTPVFQGSFEVVPAHGR